MTRTMDMGGLCIIAYNFEVEHAYLLLMSDHSTGVRGRNVPPNILDLFLYCNGMLVEKHGERGHFR